MPAVTVAKARRQDRAQRIGIEFGRGDRSRVEPSISGVIPRPVSTTPVGRWPIAMP
jgi:hypothetical protein